MPEFNADYVEMPGYNEEVQFDPIQILKLRALK
jgi:hypothetical protein